jgi:uncharacterized damage-inducible protein DinB
MQGPITGPLMVHLGPTPPYGTLERNPAAVNADALRHFFGYHFAENRTVWDRYISQLSDAQFTQPAAYSIGSVRDQIVHIMSADNTWFCGLRGLAIPDFLDPAAFSDRALLRAFWDELEAMMRAYLDALTDAMLPTKPLEGEDANLTVWQVLLHVVNHGTDHRAQLLRTLNDLGVKTVSQDYIFYVYDNP